MWCILFGSCFVGCVTKKGNLEGCTMARHIFLPKSFLYLAILLAVVIPNQVYPKDYYVDGNAGNDGGAGSYEDAWRTITHAASKASRTDTIYVKYAIYHESISFTPIPKRSINLIGIACEDARPIICSADPNTHAIGLTNYAGTIQGLEITGASNANGINCNASNGGTNAAQIRDCKIYGNNIGIHITTAGSTDECSPHIYKNFIYSNTTRGIGNMMYSSATIEANYIYENGRASEGNGGVGNRDNSTATIVNNIIHDNDHIGISIRDNSNPKIINNTITSHNAADPLSAAVRVRQNEGISSVAIVNNIIARNKCGLASEFGQPCSGNDYNDVWNNSLSDYIGFAKGLNDISSDPLFVDAESGDYHLQLGSRCITAGAPEGAPDTDFDGDVRPQGDGYDMGAYEHIVEISPLAPTLTVAVVGTTLILSWNSAANADGYTLLYAPPDISYIGHLDMGTQTTISCDLWSGTAFYVAVQAYNSAGNSDYSNIEYFLIP